MMNYDILVLSSLAFASVVYIAKRYFDGQAEIRKGQPEIQAALKKYEAALTNAIEQLFEYAKKTRAEKAEAAGTVAKFGGKPRP